jgi:hypothetical protein
LNILKDDKYQVANSAAGCGLEDLPVVAVLEELDNVFVLQGLKGEDF